MAGVNGYKRCKCRDQTGKEIGAACPKLHRPDGSWNPSHGTWYGKQDCKAVSGLPRLTLRQGGFPNKDAMTAWFDAAMQLLAIPEEGREGYVARAEILALIKESRKLGTALPSYDDLRRRHSEGAAFRPGTTGSYLLTWLDSHREAGDWAPTTQHSYDRAVHRLFLPAFGDVALDKLRSNHILAMLRGLDAEADRIREARSSPDPEVRKTAAGLRPPGPATKARYLAVIRSALAEAMSPQQRIITSNVAAGIKVGRSGKRGRMRARLWTPERERAWREGYEARLEAAGEHLTRQQRFAIWHSLPARPGSVMVWMREHLGAFLDAAVDERLYPLFCIIGHCGLRRGEACGLPWPEVDLEGAVATIDSQIVQVGWKPVTEVAKTDSALAHVSLDTVTVAALRAWRKQQLSERIAWGPAWQDTGLVFTREDGTAWHPSYLTARFERLAFTAGLPPIRLHDLRHGVATLALAAGEDITTVSRLLRHSSIQITADIYAEILPEMAAATAEKVAGMVPRRPRARGDSETGGLPAVSLDRTERLS